MKTLGITINGVLRDFNFQFEKLYRKTFIKNESLVGMDDNFFAVEAEESQEEYEKIKNLERELINTPVDTADLLNHFKFDDVESFNKFLEDYTFPIYGAAPAMPKSFDTLLKIQQISEASKYFEVVLISTEKSQAISSTLHFLAKNGARIKNIKFVDRYSEVWKHCDILLSETPEVFETKPEGKLSVKLETLYNTYSQSDYSIKNLSDFVEIEFLKGIFAK